MRRERRDRREISKMRERERRENIEKTEIREKKREQIREMREQRGEIRYRTDIIEREERREIRGIIGGSCVLSRRGGSSPTCWGRWSDANGPYPREPGAFWSTVTQM